MDGRNRPVAQDISFVSMYVRVPAELKYLIVCYQNHSRLPSFNMAARRLLETHPALASLAAELYNDSKAPTGPGNPQLGSTRR